MRVLICPTEFGATLTARQAAETIASAWRSSAPHDELRVVALSDGGSGFLEVVHAAAGGLLMGTVAPDSLGVHTPATVLMCDGQDGRRTGYIEASQVSVSSLASSVADRALDLGSSYGVGHLMEIALDEGAERIVLAVGRTDLLDGGAGLLAALGAGPAQSLARGGLHLERAEVDCLDMLALTRERFAGVDLVLATDDPAPLLGFSGAAAQAMQGGLDPQRAQRAEAALGHFSDLAARRLPASIDLLTGLPRRLEREPGAGAGGGIGYALLLLGARRVSAVDMMIEICGLRELIAQSDLVVTGEGCFDHTSLRDSVPAAVSSLAAAKATPAIMIAGQSLVGRREGMALGLSGVYSVAPVRSTHGPTAWPGDNPIERLAERVSRVAATWSPPPR